MLAVFLTMVSMWFIYRMIGKAKSWYILLGAAGFSAYYLWLMQGRSRLSVGCTSSSTFIWPAESRMPMLPSFSCSFNTSWEPGSSRKSLRLCLSLPWSRRPLYDPGSAGQDWDRGTARWHSDRRRFRGGFAIMETLIQYTPRDLVNTWTTTVLAFRGVPQSKTSTPC